MKKLFEAIKHDWDIENFTKDDFIFYGIIAPITLICVCMAGEYIGQLLSTL